MEDGTQHFVEQLDWQTLFERSVYHSGDVYENLILGAFDDRIAAEADAINRTVGALFHPCFSRPILAVSSSGYLHQQPGVLDKELWTQRVIELYEQMDVEFKTIESRFAHFVQFQLMAFFVTMQNTEGHHQRYFQAWPCLTILLNIRSDDCKHKD